MKEVEKRLADMEKLLAMVIGYLEAANPELKAHNLFGAVQQPTKGDTHA